MMVALGIFVSDVACVILCSFGAVPFFKDESNQLWLGVVGAVVLFGLGLKYLVRPTISADVELKLHAGHHTAFFLKGFLVNFVNPFVFLVWVGVIGHAQVKFGAGKDLHIFLLAALLAILTTDTLKVVFAHHIKRFIAPTMLVRTYQVIGVLLILFGIRMLWTVI
jgi:threonine/homoserine/homoserine lactone efflux protein